MFLSKGHRDLRFAFQTHPGQFDPVLPLPRLSLALSSILPAPALTKPSVLQCLALDHVHRLRCPSWDLNGPTP